MLSRKWSLRCAVAAEQVTARHGKQTLRQNAMHPPRALKPSVAPCPRAPAPPPSQQEAGIATATAQQYPFPDIERKWQKYWADNQTFRTPDIHELDKSKPKFYALDMFPYPSGAGLHVGHPEGYTATGDADVMHGERVRLAGMTPTVSPLPLTLLSFVTLPSHLTWLSPCSVSSHSLLISPGSHPAQFRNTAFSSHLALFVSHLVCSLFFCLMSLPLFPSWTPIHPSH